MNSDEMVFPVIPANEEARTSPFPQSIYFLRRNKGSLGVLHVNLRGPAQKTDKWVVMDRQLNISGKRLVARGRIEIAVVDDKTMIGPVYRFQNGRFNKHQVDSDYVRREVINAIHSSCGGGGAPTRVPKRLYENWTIEAKEDLDACRRPLANPMYFVRQISGEIFK